jgi:DNA-binding MarR family transcriptional regulator
MTMQVRRLEDAGLVSRTVDPDDARAVLIRITDKGVDMLRQVRVDRGAAIDPYLERLDEADRRTLDDAVRVMRKLLKDAAAPKPTVKEQ